MIETTRKHWLSMGMLLLLPLAGATYWQGKTAADGWMMDMTHKAGFVLSNLSIEGNARTPRNQILAQLDIDTGMPILAVNLGVIQNRIEALPWVKAASVKRVFPGDIKIEITEREPFAIWQLNQSHFLIDSEGVIILEHGLSVFSGLPLLVGKGAPDAAPQLFSMLAGQSVLGKYVRTAVRVGERRWDLLFANGIRLKLPADEDLNYNSNDAWLRFSRLEANHSLLAREVNVIDVRLHDQLVMRLTPRGKKLIDGKQLAA
ncbi:MAG: hypothetical protein COB37_04085 [Kordiimonadales bacterium]|nr:MAG: hypothetical protein COB37_04085 [Kordiimonadales bacterium]